MNFKEMLERVRCCLTEAEELGLPAFDVTNIDELISTGEPGVAFEILCTQLDEHDIPISVRMHTQLAEVGAAMSIDERYWKTLEK